MLTGIYQIVNKLNNKRYVGSSVDIERRWHQHRNYLHVGRHPNAHFQAAFLKYGESNFHFGILEFCQAKDLLVYEQKWIDDVMPEYNMCLVAGNTTGVHPSDEIRAKLSSAHKEYYQTFAGQVARLFRPKANYGPKKGTPQPHLKKYRLQPGAGRKGEDNPPAKLTAQQVAEIREKIIAGKHGIQRQLAKEYNVHFSTISAIKCGINWKEV